MVKKISNALHSKNSLTSASIILIITLFLSNVLGVIRDHFLTQKIPTDSLSVYYAAFLIPDLIFNVLILGAMASAFIPVFTTLITQKKTKEAWLVAESIINLGIIFLIIFAVIIFFLIPYLSPIVTPGFTGERQELMIRLVRIMLLSPIFFGLSYILGGILNSFKRFFVYSLAPLVYNLIIILGTIFFSDRFGIMAVAVSVVVGAFLHFLIQLPVAIKLGFRYHFRLALKHWGVKRIGLLMLPRAAALGANQIMLVIFTAIASSINGYSNAAYNLANNIQTMPTVVFATAFATAIFPTLAEAYSKNESELFSSQVEKFTRIIIFFMMPLGLMLIILRTEIVRLILGSGFFGWDQTIQTAQTLGFFSLSLVFSGLTPLFARSFYAIHNTKIPMILTVLNVIVSVALGKIFAERFGVSGLALGFSGGTFISTIFYYFILRTKINLQNEGKLIFFIIKVLAATILMAIGMQEVKILSGFFLDMQHTLGVLSKVALTLGTGVLIYSLCAWIFGCEEMAAVKYLFSRFNLRGGGLGENENQE